MASHSSTRLLSALLLLAAAALAATETPPQNATQPEVPPKPEVDTSLPLVCIIIRTYWGHGKHGNNNLKKLIKVFQDQSYTNWVMQLIVMDNRPFPDLRYIVKDADDDRIWVFAEWISYKYAPRTENRQWTPGYHGKLYNLTDDAIRACPEDTEWVLVTNGDNNYDVRLLEELPAAKGKDIVAFDYYSRYQRPTAPPCMRFEAGDSLAPCKENGVRWCQTDLSANMYSFKRLVAENKRFGLADPMGISADGMLVQDLINSGWQAHHVRGKCLVEHAPTPQVCAQMGLVWDDSAAATQEATGGTCITKEAAEKMLAADPGLESLTFSVAHDGSSFDFKPGPLELTCIRQRDPRRWDLMRFFGPACASRFDAAPGWPTT